MSAKLTKDDVVALARLAKLKLSDKEVEAYQKDLVAILDYVDQLAKADTAGLEPTSQVTGLENVTREDEVRQQLATPEKLMEGVPRTKDGYIQVGRMV